MYIVTVKSCYDNFDYITFFSDIENAIQYAERKSEDTRQYDDGSTIYPRVVIHNVSFNNEYHMDSILLDEQFAIRIFN